MCAESADLTLCKSTAKMMAPNAAVKRTPPTNPCFDMTNSETNFAVDSFALHIHGFDCTYRFFCVATQNNSGGS